jgi:hypothetical protein
LLLGKVISSRNFQVAPRSGLLRGRFCAGLLDLLQQLLQHLDRAADAQQDSCKLDRLASKSAGTSWSFSNLELRSAKRHSRFFSCLGIHAA